MAAGPIECRTSRCHSCVIDHDARDQADPEHGVAGQQQRQPRLPGGQMRDEQGAGGRADHGRDHGHQPPAERGVGGGPHPGEHQVRHGQAAGQAGQRPERPQHRVDDEGGVSADQRRAEQQGPGPDGQQRHRRRAVELHHDRVPGVSQRGLAVPGPVHDLGRGQHHEPRSGQHPDSGGEAAQPRPLDRQGDRRGGHDAGAHHRGEPVGPEVGEGVRGPFQVAEQAAAAGLARSGRGRRGRLGRRQPGAGRGGTGGRARGHNTSLRQDGARR